MWHETKEMISMPVLSPTWSLRGHILRVPPGKTKSPKVLTFKGKVEEPWLHWANLHSGGVSLTFVVEDIPSAERLARLGYGAVAALGTYLNDAAIDEIVFCMDLFSTSQRPRLFMALDRDAVSRSMEYANRIRLRRGQCEVVIPQPRDFKNLTDEEIMDCLENALS
jgi:hypothetical protein